MLGGGNTLAQTNHDLFRCRDVIESLVPATSNEG